MINKSLTFNFLRMKHSYISCSQEDENDKPIHNSSFIVHHFLRMKQIILFTIFFVPVLSCPARNYYVKPNGISGLTGSSWDWASNDLQGTIEKASAGDIVYVAAGTYHGGFIMKEGVTVMGGYTANRSNPAERCNVMETDDPSKQSILDGEGKQRVLTQLVPFSTPTHWEGFVIQNGKTSVDFKVGSIIYSNQGDNKIIGVLYKYNLESHEGMMIGTEEVKKQWGGYEAEISGLSIIADRESAKNDLPNSDYTEKILAALDDHCMDFSMENYPSNGNYAAYWCDTLTLGGYTEWFLPSPGDMQEVYEANIYPILKNVRKNMNTAYWTASHVGNALAWAYCFGKDYFHPALKYVNHLVSAVHSFITPENPSGIYFAGGGAFLGKNGIVENCIVKGNESTSQGGGVYVGRGAQLINCRVEGNKAPEGKEIYYETSTGTVFVDERSQIRVYPNPIGPGERIQIDWDGNTNIPVGYRLVNAASGMILSKGELKAENNSLSAPAQKGIFILQLSSESRNHQLKIIVN
jgi:hypothetical protein